MADPERFQVKRGRGPHYAQIPLALLRDERVGSLGIAVYVSLRSFADFGKAEGAFPSLATAANLAQMSVPTFIKYRAILQNAGWVEWVERLGRTPLYTVNFSLEGYKEDLEVGSKGGLHPSQLGLDPPPPQGSHDRKTAPIDTNHSERLASPEAKQQFLDTVRELSQPGPHPVPSGGRA